MVAIRPDDALVVVDVQHDFLPGGALAVPNGDRIFGPINALAPHFRRVYATRDVAGTHRAALDPRFDRTNVDVVIDKGVDVTTDGYSGFAATALADDLRAHAIGRVFVCGLATDYCVKATA